MATGDGKFLVWPASLSLTVAEPSQKNPMPPEQAPEPDEPILGLLRAARTERAPAALQAQISALREAPRSRRSSWLPGARLRLVPATMAAAAAAAAAAATLVVALGGAGAPSIAQAAALAVRPPQAPAPAQDPRAPARLLATRVGSLHFPNWQPREGWRATGQRRDQLGDRTAVTVYYRSGSRQVAYTILSAPALGGGEETLVRAPHHSADEYSVGRTGGGRITVVWTEAGHTCLLTGFAGVSAAELWRLAFERD
jgi:hypothetical protein